MRFFARSFYSYHIFISYKLKRNSSLSFFFFLVSLRYRSWDDSWHFWQKCHESIFSNKEFLRRVEKLKSMNHLPLSLRYRSRTQEMIHAFLCLQPSPGAISRETIGFSTECLNYHLSIIVSVSWLIMSESRDRTWCWSKVKKCMNHLSRHWTIDER